MKKIALVFVAILIFTDAFTTSKSFSPKPKASDIFVPIDANGKKISLLELSVISPKDMQAIAGKKMNFAERISFKVAQNKLRKSIAADGTIDNKTLERFFQKRGGETGFHFGGFALGFFLTLIGVLIAYLINDDYKKNRVKWAWIGLVISVVFWTALALLAA